MLGFPARHWERYRRNERRGLGIVLSLQLAAVRFYDSPDAVQTKPIMSLYDVAEWFSAPILGIRRENCFWFTKREHQPSIGPSDLCN